MLIFMRCKMLWHLCGDQKKGWKCMILGDIVILLFSFIRWICRRSWMGYRGRLNNQCLLFINWKTLKTHILSSCRRLRYGFRYMTFPEVVYRRTLRRMWECHLGGILNQTYKILMVYGSQACVFVWLWTWRSH